MINYGLKIKWNKHPELSSVVLLLHVIAALSDCHLLSFVMHPRPPPKVVRAIRFISVSNAFWRAFTSVLLPIRPDQKKKTHEVITYKQTQWLWELCADIMHMLVINGIMIRCLLLLTVDSERAFIGKKAWSILDRCKKNAFIFISLKMRFTWFCIIDSSCWVLWIVRLNGFWRIQF